MDDMDMSAAVQATTAAKRALLSMLEHNRGTTDWTDNKLPAPPAAAPDSFSVLSVLPGC